MGFKKKVDFGDGRSGQDKVGIPSHFHNHLGTRSRRDMISDFKAISIFAIFIGLFG
jgi:hypothetical protein